jgi:pimeloyl-ACP methyl ester carboxylesterase
MTKTVYYLPGFGGQLGSGLGQGLLSRGCEVTGRETRGEFKELTFKDQVNTVSEDLAQHFWHNDSYVIANSFGAYLFLHAQAQLPPYVGNLLLLSPIVGDFRNEQVNMGFVPPFPEKLIQLAEAGVFPKPLKCQIHVGTEDWQSVPANVVKFAELVGLEVKLVQGAGHMLGKDYVGGVLDSWLKN